MSDKIRFMLIVDGKSQSGKHTVPHIVHVAEYEFAQWPGCSAQDLRKKFRDRTRKVAVGMPGRTIKQEIVMESTFYHSR